MDSYQAKKIIAIKTKFCVPSCIRPSFSFQGRSLDILQFELSVKAGDFREKLDYLSDKNNNLTGALVIQ